MASNSLATLACELGNRRLQNMRKATGGQTAGLAIDSDLEFFKPWSLDDRTGLGMSSDALIARKRCAKSPNDPKLSDPARGTRGLKPRCQAGFAAARGCVKTPQRLGDEKTRRSRFCYGAFLFLAKVI